MLTSMLCANLDNADRTWQVPSGPGIECMETPTFKTKIKRAILPVVRARGQTSFALQLPERARLLDVGCGLASPFRMKTLRPDLYYVGLDIQRTDQPESMKLVTDEYHQTSPEGFDAAIRELGERAFDAVISSHNIEHTQKPFAVVEAMCSALRPGGQLYFAFPSEKSPAFPHREGTLNFYDDKTHVWLPRFDELLAVLRRNGVHPVYQSQRYRPALYFLIGAVTEPYSAITRRVGPFAGTWALYGFESVIWGRRTQEKLAAVAAG